MSAPPPSLSLIKYVVSTVSYTFDQYLYRTIALLLFLLKPKHKGIVNVQLCAYTNHANTICVSAVYC